MKSKKDSVGQKIVDGAYRTMLERLGSSTNPNFLLLNYASQSMEVLNLVVIPKHFFTPGIIEKRKALAPSARRAGWVGCNIRLHTIPEAGKIYMIRENKVVTRAKVLSEWRRTLFLREEKEMSAKGWLLDVMRCVENLHKPEFTLDDVYKFESMLAGLHPQNSHIRDKIRQQLQLLRDSGYLRFLGAGRYRLT